MVCTVTSRGPQLHADHHLQHRPRARHGARAHPAEGPGKLKLYVRLDATVGGHGGGGAQNAGADSATADRTALVAGDTTTETAAVNRDYAQPTFLALQADKRFNQASAGYAGTASDGLTSSTAPAG